MTTVHLVRAVDAARGWHLHQMDMKNAFLQGDLKAEVYMVHHLEFLSKVHESVVCQLKKSLYRLKRALRKNPTVKHIGDEGLREPSLLPRN